MPVVVVDEAYAEFAGSTVLPLRFDYPRLVVVRTMSKAHALAGARVGFAIARPETLAPILSYRAPASVGTISAALATASLNRPELAAGNIARIAEQRARLTRELTSSRLATVPVVHQLHPHTIRLASDSRHCGGDSPSQWFGSADVRVRAQVRRLHQADRSVGHRKRQTPRSSQGDKRMTNPLGTVVASGDRSATITRSTKETQITVTLKLDGNGDTNIETGVGFFDHLLNSLAHHALFDLNIEAQGDLAVDEHHTVEDVALVIGTALAAALGDRTGIVRFGDAIVPMDEAVATVAVDVGGRPYAVVRLPFRGKRVGKMPLELIEHIIESLARASGTTINIDGRGRSDHHLAEASFKALGRALRAATTPDPRRSGAASTKGSLG